MSANWPRVWLALCCTGLVPQLGAQEADEAHARIESLRNQATITFSAEEAACYTRFAVTGCVQEVNARRTALLADLKRREAILNDGERQQKVEQKRQRLKEYNEERRASNPERSGQGL